ncbi:MAG: kynurenine formamidase [Salinirussus sp.]|jgi:kynurenine formamidase
MTEETTRTETDETDSSVQRRRFLQGMGVTAAAAAVGLGPGTAAAQEADLSPAGRLLADMPDNWGRWGEEDELGMLNELGSEEMFRGMEAVMEGGPENIERFTLQTPMTGEAIDALVGQGEFPTTDTGDPAFPGRFPARKDNTADWRNADDNAGMRFADDRFDAPLYLQGTSHVDALGHGWFADRDTNDDGTVDQADEQLYNGFSAETSATTRSYDLPVTGLSPSDAGEEEAAAVDEVNTLSRADISNAADAGIQGRGVLLDVGRELGGGENGWLDLNESVTLQDLRDTADAQGVEIQERDILIIRTGSIERARDPEAPWHALAEPGLKYSDALVEFIDEMDIPYIAGDNLPVEKVQHQVTAEDLNDGREDLAGTYLLPVHGACLRNLGVTINEVLDLSDLAAACAEDGVYTFLFTAAPLHVEGGTGAPVNPVVTKATGVQDTGQADSGEDTETETQTDMETETVGEPADTATEEGTAGAGSSGFGVGSALAALAGLAGAKAFEEHTREE